jgi:hypothetical protein
MDVGLWMTSIVYDFLISATSALQANAAVASGDSFAKGLPNYLLTQFWLKPMPDACSWKCGKAYQYHFLINVRTTNNTICKH